MNDLPIEIWRLIALSHTKCWYLLQHTIKGLFTPAEHADLVEKMEKLSVVTKKRPGTTSSQSLEITTLDGRLHSVGGGYSLVCTAGHGNTLSIKSKYGQLHSSGGWTVLFSSGSIHFIASFRNGALSNSSADRWAWAGRRLYVSLYCERRPASRNRYEKKKYRPAVGRIIT